MGLELNERKRAILDLRLVRLLHCSPLRPLCLRDHINRMSGMKLEFLELISYSNWYHPPSTPLEGAQHRPSSVLAIWGRLESCHEGTIQEEECWWKDLYHSQIVHLSFRTVARFEEKTMRGGTALVLGHTQVHSVAVGNPMLTTTSPKDENRRPMPGCPSMVSRGNET
jgi:hypothetical protein